MPRLIAFLAATAACVFAAPAAANDKPDCSAAARLTLEPILVEVVDFDRSGGFDNDIDGNNPRISIKLTGRVDPGAPDKADDDRLDIAVQVSIRESKPDHTTFTGTGGASVRLDRVLAYGCGTKAESVSGALEADGGQDNHAWTSYPNGRGLIASASCLSDTKGADSDQLACRVSLHPVPLPQQPLANYQPPVCGQTDIVVALPPIEVLNLPHVRNGPDSEMNGNNPVILVTVEAASGHLSTAQRVSDTQIHLQGQVMMTEGKPDFSQFRNGFSTVYDFAHLIPPNCRVLTSLSESGELQADGGKDNHLWTRYSGKGLLREARCLSDTQGDDANRLGCTLLLNDVTVKLVP